MTTLYVNAVTGDDTTGTGALLNPFRTVNRARTALSNGGHQILARRGTTQRLTAVQGNFRSGASAADPFVYGVYGPESDGPFTFTADSPIGDLMYILSGENNVRIEGYRFDGNGIVTRPFQAQADTANTTGIVLRRCEFINGPAVGAYVENKNSALRTLSVDFEDCLHERNGSHGFYARGVLTSNLRRCEARYNGAIVLTGGHGFSSQAEFVAYTTGWSGPVGQVYSRSHTAPVLKVASTAGAYPVLSNAGATTTPALGQYGVTGGLLYVNVGASDVNTLTTTVMTSASPVLLYEDCIAHHNIHMPLALFREGHGFAADDFSNARFVRCVSYENEGAGFSLNAGDGSRIEACIAAGNRAAGVSVARGIGNTIIHGAFVGNDLLPHHNAQMLFQAGSASNVARNNIVVGGGTNGIRGDATSGTNTVQNNLVFGMPTAVNGITASGTVIADPMLADPGRPWLGLKPGSPAWRAGVAIQGARDRFGRRYPNPSHIGPWAVEAR